MPQLALFLRIVRSTKKNLRNGVQWGMSGEEPLSNLKDQVEQLQVKMAQDPSEALQQKLEIAEKQLSDLLAQKEEQDWTMMRKIMGEEMDSSMQASLDYAVIRQFIFRGHPRFTTMDEHKNCPGVPRSGFCAASFLCLMADVLDVRISVCWVPGTSLSYLKFGGGRVSFLSPNDDKEVEAK